MRWWLRIELVDAWCMASVIRRIVLMLLCGIYWLLGNDFVFTYGLTECVTACCYLACCWAGCWIVTEGDECCSG